MSTTGLVLSGGGARGAYQAGVLAAISEVTSREGIEDPFKILTGVSAGSINSAILATHPGTWREGTEHLVQLWSKITTDEVFYADLLTISKGGFEWMTDFSFRRGKKTASQVRSLFSTHPLRNTLNEHCDFSNIEKKIRSGRLEALGISALDYESISTRTFFQAKASVPAWNRPMHRSEPCDINADHIMASSAIPLLFPPVKVGTHFFGDGCIRNQSPCAPAIYLGAEKLVVIGVRRRQETMFSGLHGTNEIAPSMVRIINVIFHSMMLDGVEQDITRISQTNSYLSLLDPADRKRLPVREVKFLWIAPTVDFSQFAIKKGSDLPRLIRYVLTGPGTLLESSELISYLLFEPSYCQQLIDIGYADGMKEQEQIKRLLFPEDNLSGARPRKPRSPHS